MADWPRWLASFLAFGPQRLTRHPFANSALFQASSLLSYLQGVKDANGLALYAADQLQPLVTYIAQRAALGSATSIPNEELVTNIRVEGEVLKQLPVAMYSGIGLPAEVIANSVAGVYGDDLHSHALLTAYLQSRSTAPQGERLNELTYMLPALLPVLFDRALYAHLTNDADNRNFLDQLVRQQAFAGQASQGMLTQFTRDMAALEELLLDFPRLRRQPSSRKAWSGTTGRTKRIREVDSSPRMALYYSTPPR